MKQLVKVSFKAGQLDKCPGFYDRMLEYLSAATLQKNYLEKSISNTLDYVSSTQDMDFLEKFYQVTLDSLTKAGTFEVRLNKVIHLIMVSQRLLIKTQLKLAKLLLDRKQHTKLTKLLRLLREVCTADDGQNQDDMQRKGTHLLEVYALEIQLYTETKNTKKLKEIYRECLSVKSAIPHPRIMGIVRECGGKMHMNESKNIFQLPLTKYTRRKL